MSERRSSHRVRCSVQILYSRGSGRIAGGKALDISETGARLVLAEAASSPTELTVEFEGRLQLLARAVWAERLPNGEQLVGVCFQGVHFGQELELADYLSELVLRAA